MNSTIYNFTNNWFEITGRGPWDSLIPQINPTRILEIGSYEGASTCYLIEKLATSKEIELHCIDTWEGGEEHKSADVNMSDVETRFHHNTKIAMNKAKKNVQLVPHKEFSDVALSKLITKNAYNSDLSKKLSQNKRKFLTPIQSGDLFIKIIKNA